jgi:serine/threonine protein kinase
MSFVQTLDKSRKSEEQTNLDEYDVMDEILKLFTSLFYPEPRQLIQEGPVASLEKTQPVSLTYDFSRVVTGDAIGHGSTATTYLGQIPTHEIPGQYKETVVKVLTTTRKTATIEFNREVKALQTLADTPYIVNIHGSDSGTHKLFMEYCSRGELYALIDKIGAFPETVARLYSKQLWSAVASCHSKGVAHRDLKPENVLLTEDWSLRLADFGFALTGNVQSSTQFCGSEGYAAPEIMAQRPYEPSRADVWSAGITVFCMQVGTHPFAAVDTSCWLFCRAMEGNWDAFWDQHAKFTPAAGQLTSEAKRFLQRALQPWPEARPTAAQMLADPWLLGDTHPDVASFMETAHAALESLQAVA